MALSDRALTAWAAAGSTAAVLVVGLVAAFGGLSTVPAPALDTLAVGATFTSAPMAVTVERAQVMTDVPEAYLDLEPGQEVVALVLDVVNTWDRPQYAAELEAIADVVTVTGLGAPSAYVRTDDRTTGPQLQPGVPVRMMLVWAVDDGRYAKGDDLEVTLSDMTLYTASFVTTGQWWTDPVPKAVVSVPVQGAG